jgi:hypothetical protein
LRAILHFPIDVPLRKHRWSAADAALSILSFPGYILEGLVAAKLWDEIWARDASKYSWCSMLLYTLQL